MCNRNHRDLVVWQKAMSLVETVYHLTSAFPRQESYGLTAQMRRSAISVPSNIAEGQGRGTCKDFLRFLSIASGSLKELETQLLIAGRLCLTTSEAMSRVLTQCDEVGRLLTGLKKNLRNRDDLP
jgi:four helix bundle protein